jgi:hypothetical protein
LIIRKNNEKEAKIYYPVCDFIVGLYGLYNRSGSDFREFTGVTSRND